MAVQKIMEEEIKMKERNHLQVEQPFLVKGLVFRVIEDIDVIIRIGDVVVENKKTVVQEEIIVVPKSIVVEAIKKGFLSLKRGIILDVVFIKDVFRRVGEEKGKLYP